MRNAMGLANRYAINSATGILYRQGYTFIVVKYAFSVSINASDLIGCEKL